MAAKYTASLSESRWKEHECTGCGSVYRYLFEASVTGRGHTRDGAADDADLKLRQAFKSEVKTRACPNCGLVQPDMVADVGGLLHGGLILVVLAIFGVGFVVAVLTVGKFFEPIVYPIITWGILFVSIAVLVLHVLAARRNPNADLKANLRKSANLLADGMMTLERRGQLDPSRPVQPARRRISPVQLTALVVLAFLGLAILPAAELTRLALGWPTNWKSDPVVAGPGEEVVVFLPREVQTVGGRWRGIPTVEVRNAKELGLKTAKLKAVSKEGNWGGLVVGKSARSESTRLWTEITLPEAANLSGKTLDLHIRLDAEYAAPTGIGHFENRKELLEEDRQLGVASANAGLVYRVLWWVGLIVSGLLLLFVSGWIWTIAASGKHLGKPTRVLSRREHDEQHARPADRDPAGDGRPADRVEPIFTAEVVSERPPPAVVSVSTPVADLVQPAPMARTAPVVMEMRPSVPAPIITQPPPVPAPPRVVERIAQRQEETSAAPPASDKWYYMKGGKQQGPVSLESLRALVQAAELGRHDEVWKLGTADWKPVHAVAELARA